MRYVVAPGDSLWLIARKHYGDGAKWRLIAEDNLLANPNALLVGQVLQLRDEMQGSNRQREPERFISTAAVSSEVSRQARIPLVSYVFVLADEINPLSRKLVRRVLVNPQMAAAAGQQLGRPLAVFPNPERFGFQPTDAASRLPAGRHAMGMKPSPFLSTSSKPLGATRFTGEPFWIDVNKAIDAGATLHETEEIVSDLERIAQKTQSVDARKRIQTISELVRSDREVLVRGNVPPGAVKGAAAMGATRVLQGVQIVGFAMTAVNIAHATEKSIDQGSIKPIAAESIRQAGGWAAAWAGMKLGAAGGALLGIETGPGAVVSAAIGGLVGGTAGYFGFDWIADHLDEN